MPRRRVSAAVRDAIGILAAKGNGPSAIYAALSDEKINWLGTHSVDVRTIQRIVKEGKGKDDSGPWTLTDVDPDDAKLVLDVLAREMDGNPRQSWPTRARANWIIRVRKAVPGIPRSWALTLASAYLSQELRGKDTRYLDLLLAHEVWLQASDKEFFFRAVRCARPLLGEPDALWWVLVTNEILPYWVDPGEEFASTDEKLLTGPCDYNPRIITAWDE